jgi:hypothetical protein
MVEQTDRQKRMAERKAQIASLMPQIKTVRVEPASDILRRVVKHPHGTAFPATGPATWPLDTFTKRRIADGTVTVVGGEKTEASKGGEAPKHQRPTSSTVA